MSELGNFIIEETKRQKLQKREMAANMGIAAGHFSQVIGVVPRGYNPETFARMVEGISQSAATRAKFMESYFRDSSPTKYRNWIHVDPPSPGSRVKEEPRDERAQAIEGVCRLLDELALPPDTVTDLRDIIQAIPKYTALHDLIRDLADFRRQALPLEHPVIEETLSPKQIAEKKKAGAVSYSSRPRRRRPNNNGPETKKSSR